MFEKEKKQYEEDSKNHERPWELWEYKIIGRDAYTDAGHNPHWLAGYHYRRKQTTFIPEYYSGLNWRDAEHLVGKTVEYTDNPDIGWNVGTLKKLCALDVISRFGIGLNECINVHFYTYIRTCEEKLKHPTINIGGVELPMPETVAPALGTLYWLSPTAIGHEWNGFVFDNYSLISGQVHLTKKRAEAWAVLWKSMVIDKMERN